MVWGCLGFVFATVLVSKTADFQVVTALRSTWLVPLVHFAAATRSLYRWWDQCGFHLHRWGGCREIHGSMCGLDLDLRKHGISIGPGRHLVLSVGFQWGRDVAIWMALALPVGLLSWSHQCLRTAVLLERIGGVWGWTYPQPAGWKWWRRHFAAIPWAAEKVNKDTFERVLEDAHPERCHWYWGCYFCSSFQLWWMCLGELFPQKTWSISWLLDAGRHLFQTSSDAPGISHGLAYRHLWLCFHELRWSTGANLCRLPNVHGAPSRSHQPCQFVRYIYVLFCLNCFLQRNHLHVLCWIISHRGPKPGSWCQFQCGRWIFWGLCPSDGWSIFGLVFVWSWNSTVGSRCHHLH